MMRLIARLAALAAPVMIMVAMVPVISDDWQLLGVYTILLVLTLLLGHNKRDLIFFLFGFFLLALSELFFISTGVEVFQRDILLLGMPIWLPMLWGYAFIMMHRGVTLLETYLK